MSKRNASTRTETVIDEGVSEALSDKALDAVAGGGIKGEIIPKVELRAPFKAKLAEYLDGSLYDMNIGAGELKPKG